MLRRYFHCCLTSSHSALSAVTIAISWIAGPLFDITLRAAHQLLQRDDYIRIVLGGTS